MRLDNDLLALQKPRIDVWLIAQDVEASASNLAAFKRFLQRAFINYSTSGRVDEECTVLHRSELVITDEASGGGVQWTVDRYDI